MKPQKFMVGIVAILALLGYSFFALANDSDFSFRHRVMDFRASLTLNKIGGATADGTAKIKVSLDRNRLYDTSIDVKVNNYMPISSEVLEGWLVDTQSGYKLSLGGFKTNSSGKGALKFEQDLINFPIYDKIVITKEPTNDTNPNPSTAILEANIPASSLNSIEFTAKLRGSNEVPPNNSSAKGTAKFVLDTDANTLKFDISFSGLSSAETGAHIHGPAVPGENAGILFALPAGSPKTGTWTYSESQEADILTGKTYVNIHSVNYPNGEIRAQLIP